MEEAPNRDTVLVLTHARDTHSDVVIEALQRRGIPVIRFHTEDFPQKATISVSISNDDERQVLICNECEHPLDRVKTVWNRRPRRAQVSSELAGTDHAFATDESRLLLRALWAILGDRFWVNTPVASRQGSLKPLQLTVARELGFDIPRTLMTNRAEDVASFVAACGGEAVYKTFHPYIATDAEGRTVTVYTRRLTTADVKRANALRFAPGILQERVPKRIELRVTVIGARVFAVEIHSQQSERAREDWRRYDLANTPHHPHQLPADLEQRCVQLTQRLGLVTGCLDIILTPDGRYIFLEINPDGQWYWVQQLVGLPLLEHFVEMLTQATSNYTSPVLNDRVGSVSGTATH